MRCFILLSLMQLSFGYQDVTITNYLQTNGYTTLYSALQSTGLAGALDTSGPYTLFAPTDDAFRNVDLTTFTTEQLTSILKYHVIGGFVLAPQITQSTTETTLNNQMLTIEPSAGGLLINKGAANVMPGNSDILVNNGVIHQINGVLVPPTLPTAPPTTAAPVTNAVATYNVYQLLLRDNRFNDLALACLLAGIQNTLESVEMTLFAPTNDAFAIYSSNLLDPSSPNALTIYQEVLKYHVVPGRRTASDLRSGVLYTLHGTTVNVTLGSGVQINNANVIQADMMATNGVVHAIDRLLIPQDINQVAAGKK